MRILISKWAITIMGTLLVIIVASLGTVLFRQMRDRSQLEGDLAEAEASLSDFDKAEAIAQQTDMRQRVSDALAQLDAAKVELSQPMDSIIANEALFEIARLSGVVVQGITTAPEMDGNLAQVECSLLPINMVVEGNLANLLDFITRLNTDLVNGVVETADVTAPLTVGEDMPSASIELVIYTYKGE